MFWYRYNTLCDSKCACVCVEMCVYGLYERVCVKQLFCTRKVTKMKVMIYFL